MIEALKLALREIANRAGAPTMQYCRENERREQRDSLNWIAKRAADALATLDTEKL